MILRRYIAECDWCMETYQCGAETASEMKRAALNAGWVVTNRVELICRECAVRQINNDVKHMMTRDP